MPGAWLEKLIGRNRWPDCALYRGLENSVLWVYERCMGESSSFLMALSTLAIGLWTVLGMRCKRFFCIVLISRHWLRTVNKSLIYLNFSGFSCVNSGFKAHMTIRVVPNEFCSAHTCYRSLRSLPVIELHSDNGSPMKSATMLATLQELGVIPSFSHPSVSNENPYFRVVIPHA